MAELITGRMEGEEEAPINKLPVGILVQIVSQLSFREAVRTSVVSKRWRNVWTYIPVLDFSESRRDRRRRRLSPADGYSRKKWGPLDSFNYSNWVCGVLAQRRGSGLDEFRICHYLDWRYTSLIDDWLRLAFSNRVHTLMLGLSNNILCPPKRCYTLPHPRALMAGGLGFKGFKFLKTLSLAAVNVGDDVIQYFLSNCPLLEDLYLVAIFGLRNLKVIGPSLLLRRLGVERCENIEAIEICDATNLVEFAYDGPGNLNMVLKNAPNPNMVIITLDGNILDFRNIFSKLSCCFSQLQELQVGVTSSSSQERLMDFVLPELKMLRMFVWTGVRKYKRSSLGYVAMIKNLPNLRIFVLRFRSSHNHVEEEGETDEEEEEPEGESDEEEGEEGETDEEEEEEEETDEEEDEYEEIISTEEREAILRFRHPCLRSFTIHGYCRRCDFELLKQMIENAPTLKRIIIENSVRMEIR